MTLLDQLIDKQNELGLSDRGFSRKLGISHALWSETKKGTYPIRYEILAAAAREFPTLGDAIVRYLAATERKSAATTIVSA